jgi:hypothetical protein
MVPAPECFDFSGEPTHARAHEVVCLLEVLPIVFQALTDRDGNELLNVDISVARQELEEGPTASTRAYAFC